MNPVVINQNVTPPPPVRIDLTARPWTPTEPFIAQGFGLAWTQWPDGNVEPPVKDQHK